MSNNWNDFLHFGMENTWDQMHMESCNKNWTVSKMEILKCCKNNCEKSKVYGMFAHQCFDCKCPLCNSWQNKLTECLILILSIFQLKINQFFSMFVKHSKWKCGESTFVFIFELCCYTCGKLFIFLTHVQYWEIDVWLSNALSVEHSLTDGTSHQVEGRKKCKMQLHLGHAKSVKNAISSLSRIHLNLVMLYCWLMHKNCAFLFKTFANCLKSSLLVGEHHRQHVHEQWFHKNCWNQVCIVSNYLCLTETVASTAKCFRKWWKQIQTALFSILFPFWFHFVHCALVCRMSVLTRNVGLGLVSCALFSKILNLKLTIYGN